MKHVKYLNGVLTVIAACLVLITLAVTGLIPSAKANNSPQKTITLPINPDGSVNVRLSANSEPVDINITQVGGYNISNSVPVETKTP